YNASCYPLGPGRAIKFTTDEPTGIAETPLSGEVGRRGLAVVPSLFRGAAMVHWNLGRDGDAEVRVFDASGRLVRTLASGPAKAGSYGVVWDGRDERGCRVARGIYFVRLTTSEQTVRVKAILTE
ncbi:MAG: FlgD immunoglobulin-like domain containing protein, partial [candidate division WOR-3 bacterium]